MKHSLYLASVLLLPVLGFGMTLDELTETAYQKSLQKVELDGKRQAMQYEKEALSAYDPITLEGSTRRIRADERSGDGMEYGLMVGFTAKNPYLTEARNAQMDAMIATITGSLELQKGLLRVELKRQYLLSQLGKEAGSVTEQKKLLAEEAYTIAQKKHVAGRISQMELVRFETERAVAEKEYRQWQMAVQKHQDVLREKALIEEEIVIDDLAFGFIRPMNIQERIDRSPVVKAYSAALEEMDRSIDTLRRSRVESVGIGVGMTQEPTQNSVDLRLTVPLALGSKNEKKIAALMAQRSALVHQKALSEQKLKASIRFYLSRLDAMEGSITESSAVEKKHESLYKMAKKGFEGGVVGLFEYLETKNRFYESKIETLRLKQNYAEETAAMEETLGGTWE